MALFNQLCLLSGFTSSRPLAATLCGKPSPCSPRDLSPPLKYSPHRCSRTPSAAQHITGLAFVSPAAVIALHSSTEVFLPRNQAPNPSSLNSAVRFKLGEAPIRKINPTARQCFFPHLSKLRQLQTNVAMNRGFGGIFEIFFFFLTLEILTSA